MKEDMLIPSKHCLLCGECDMNSEESGIRIKNHAANNISSCELARALLKSMERHGMIVEDTRDSQKGDMRCIIISLFHSMARHSQ